MIMSVADRRANFTKIAHRLIYEKGYKATTMRDIAQNMGCDVANIYNYTKSKESILEQSLFDTSAIFHEGIKKLMRNELTPKEKLIEIIKLHVTISYERPYQAAFLIDEWRHLSNEKLNLFLKERHQYESWIFDIFNTGIMSNDFRIIDPKIASITFLSSIRWVHNQFVNGSSPKQRIELEVHLTNCIIGGYCS